VTSLHSYFSKSGFFSVGCIQSASPVGSILPVRGQGKILCVNGKSLGPLPPGPLSAAGLVAAAVLTSAVPPTVRMVTR